jgi:hypothetical protein
MRRIIQATSAALLLASAVVAAQAPAPARHRLPRGRPVDLNGIWGVARRQPRNRRVGEMAAAA